MNQLTSDHGWDVENETEFLTPILARLRERGVRSSLFVDPDPVYSAQACAVGADRIELYTEAYANAWGTASENTIWGAYNETAKEAQRVGIGVNAGHDLDLENLSRFLEVEGVLEVSIGHALTIECLNSGIESVIRRYLDICK